MKVFTPPPETRIVGGGNPPADVNALTECVTAMGAQGNVLSGLYGTAGSTGSTESTTPIQDALYANAGGTATLPPGSTFLVSNLTIPSQTAFNLNGSTLTGKSGPSM
jgi:hypothetical protein